MKNKAHQLLLQKLLLKRNDNKRLWTAWLALLVGCLLLFLSVMLWSIFQEVLVGKKNGSDSLGSTYLTISKVVTDASMSQAALNNINSAELNSIKQAPQVQDAGLLCPANFKVAASLGSGGLNIYTLLFLEAVPDRFIEKLPDTWSWKEGDAVLPIILSRDFLNMYNYIFAPSQGLPLLSESSIKALSFILTVGEGPQQKNFRAQIEGFSDRISSVLVPMSFIEYGNIHFSTLGTNEHSASRVLLKVADPSKKEFADFLTQHHYQTNSELLRFNKVRSIVQMVSYATGVLALLIIGIGALVFLLFIELSLSQAQEKIRLLLTLGYSPRLLILFLLKHYIPMVLSAVAVALLLASCIQYYCALKLKTLALDISSLPSFWVWICAIASGTLILIKVFSTIKRAIQKS